MYRNRSPTDTFPVAGYTRRIQPPDGVTIAPAHIDDELPEHHRDAGRVIVIERTGFAPLKLSNASLLAEGTTITAKKDDRGFYVRIYASNQKLVAHVEYVTRWNSEANASTVYVVDNAKELARKLLDHNPMQFVVGYPPAERYAEKQHRLETTLRRQYFSLVSRLLTEVPGAAVDL